MIQRREKAEELHGWREVGRGGGYERGKKRGGWEDGRMEGAVGKRPRKRFT